MFDGKFFCQISIIFVTVLTSWNVSENVRNLQPIQIKTAKDLFQWSPHSWGFVWLSVRYCAVRTDIGRHVNHNSTDWHLELMVVCSFFLSSLEEIYILGSTNTDAQTFWELPETIFLISFICWYCDIILSLHSLSALRLTSKSLANSWLEHHLIFLQLIYVAVALFSESFLSLHQ